MMSALAVIPSPSCCTLCSHGLSSPSCCPTDPPQRPEDFQTWPCKDHQLINPKNIKNYLILRGEIYLGFLWSMVRLDYHAIVYRVKLRFLRQLTCLSNTYLASMSLCCKMVKTMSSWAAGTWMSTFMPMVTMSGLSGLQKSTWGCSMYTCVKIWMCNHVPWWNPTTRVIVDFMKIIHDFKQCLNKCIVLNISL